MVTYECVSSFFFFGSVYVHIIIIHKELISYLVRNHIILSYALLLGRSKYYNYTVARILVISLVEEFTGKTN